MITRGREVAVESPMNKIDSIAPAGGGEIGACEGLQRRRDDLPKTRIVIWLESEPSFCTGVTWAPRRLFE